MPLHLAGLDGHPDIALDRNPIVVGRHRGCDVRLASHRVSRRHCCLSTNRHVVLVRDLNSTNGTCINGQRIDLAILRPGDELSIAQFRYRLDGPSESDERGAPRCP